MREQKTIPPEINIIRLQHSKGLQLPNYETSGSAGMDLRAALKDGESITLAPNTRTLIPTGLMFEIPHGFEAQIRPRSGLAFKNGITCLNTPGTIDSDYRGEVKVLLINLGDEPFEIRHNMRIAQMVIAPVVQLILREVDTLTITERGSAGFGSTGTN